MTPEQRRARDREYGRKRYAADPAKFRERARIARLRDPGAFARRQRERRIQNYEEVRPVEKRQERARILASYGLTEADYAALLALQGGRCVLCPKTTDLVVDHCHRTGKVRGILCRGCNGKLSAIENPAFKAAAEAYLCRSV